MLVNFVMFVLACLVLAKAGTWVVKGLTNLSEALNIGEFAIGFIIMAFATSLPELFVSISGSITKNSGLILGNIIGSNIANLSLVLGIGILIMKGVDVETKATRTDSLHMFLVLLLPLLLMVDGNLSRIDGIILIGIFVVYLIKLYKQRNRISEKKYKINKFQIFNSFALTFLSIILLIIASNFVVKYASKIAINFGVSEILIGLIFVAVGTSLPELTFQIKSALSGYYKMGLGTIIGSVVFNSTLILGLAALINPITADYVLFLSSAVFLIVLGFLVITFIESENKLTLKEGLSLLFFYILFLIVELSIKGII